MAYNSTDIIQKIEAIETQVKTDWDGDENTQKKILLLKPLCETRFKSVYADFFPVAEFNQLYSHLTNLTSYLQNYKTNTGYLQHIEDTITSIIISISKIPAAGKDDTKVSLTKIIDDFEKKNTAIISNITKEKEDFENEMSDLKKTLTSLSGEITKKNTEVISLTTEFQKQFSEAQDKRSTAFEEMQKKHYEEIKDKEQQRDMDFSHERGLFAESVQSTYKEIEDIQKKVEAIYGVIGKSSIIGAQKDYADRSTKAAQRTFWSAIGIMVVVALIVIFPLLSAMIDKAVDLKDIKWEMLLYRLPIAGILLLPAFYLANESKKHRDKETKYRELEIKMAAITPYFLEISDGASKDNENLPEKDRVKLELAQKLLSPSEMKLDNNVVLPPEISDIIKTMAEALSKKV